MIFGPKLLGYRITKLSTVIDPLLIVREFTVVVDDWDGNVESHPPERVKP